MSWPTWSSTGAHLPAVVANPAVAAPMQTGMLPAGINSAPAAAPPGVQYSAEQWAQVQQQNWQQWAQWQQQYQQWHQQYGAEYQKSLNAIANGLPTPVASLPNMNAAVPPPLPNDKKLIPPPEELGRTGSSLLGNAPLYNTMPPKVSLGYNTAPQQQFNNIPQQSQIGIIRPNWNVNKRPLNIGDYTNNKRQMTDNLNKTGNSVQQKNIQWQTQPSIQSTAITPHKTPGNLEELSEAEKKFDKEFAAWEAQFNKWKEQNISHPDKTQYREYEKKWESWRNSLLERREQMRKKRQAMQALVVNGSKQTLPQQMADKQLLLSEPYSINATHADLFNKPPPTQNSDPLTFKPDIPGQVEENTFLKLSTTCEIPGLDLVKDDEESTEVQTPTDEFKKQETIAESKGPDLDAISKGIKSILGDQKLLSMLSLVSQNQNLMEHALPDTSTKPPGYDQTYKVSSNIYSEPPPNQLIKYSDIPRKTVYDDYREPREIVNNFDDQTCMSFPHNGPTEQEICYSTQDNFNTNQNRFPSRNESSVRFEVPPPEHNYIFDSEGVNNKYGRFNEGSKRDDRNSYNNCGLQTRDKTNQGTHYNSNCFDTCKDNFNKSNFNNRNQLQEQHTEDQYNKCYKRYEELNQKNDCGYDNNYISSQKDNCNEEKWKEEKDFEKYHEMFNENDQKSVPSDLVQAPEAPHLTPQEDDLFEPQIVIDYEHKLNKPIEAEIMLEPVYMFDYRHKALNRIPYPQRPKWLSEVVKNIRQFDPLAARISLERPKSFDSQSVFNRTRDSERFPLERRQDLREEKYSRRPQFQDRNADRCKDYDNDRKRYRDTDRDTRYNDRLINERVPVEKNKYIKEHRDEFEELSDDEWIDNDDGEVTNQITCDMSTHPVSSVSKQQISMVEDLINPPGRYSRPPRIVIILRGPSGSGKTYLAKLIKDKEVECGGSAPRILSLDDYFMVEQEKEIVEDGKKSRVKEMVYEYEPEMLDAYRQSFIKSFKKTVTDGYFPFIIVDNINDKVKYFGEMWSFAKQKGFQVYICQLDLDPQLCIKRNVHYRTLQEIEECIAGWEPTPPHHPQIDGSSFLQTTITEVEMEDETPSEVIMEGGPELNSMESANHSGHPERWRSICNWTTAGRKQDPVNQGRRGFVGPIWRNRNIRQR